MTIQNEHTFSIELHSSESIRVDIPRDNSGNVLFEGCLGSLLSVAFVEGVVLQVEGSNGTLRLDMSEEDWSRIFRKEGEDR